MSSVNGSKSGKSNESAKPLNSSGSKSVLSEYIGLPKPQAVKSYVSSIYAWFSGGSSTEAVNKDAHQQSTAQVTLAPTAGNRKGLAVHPSQLPASRNLIPIDKASTPDGEPLSGPASAESTSNNTTQTNFSDLSTTPSDVSIGPKTAIEGGAGGNGKEKEDDSWATEMKDVSSPNVTNIISDKSDKEVKDKLANIKSEGEAAPAPSAQPYDDVQFSFMNQLRTLEDEKNKDFVVPDEVYFACDKPPQIHPPNSTKMCVKPPPSKLPSLPPLPSLPDVKKVGTLLTNLITKKSQGESSGSNEATSKEPPPKQ